MAELGSASIMNRLGLETVHSFRNSAAYIQSWIKALKNDPKMIFIYGQNDPWTAAGVTWLKNKKNIHVFVEPGGSHLARIGTMSEDQKQKVMSLLRGWLEE